VATEEDRTWSEKVTDVVTLGTPHLGADLALGVGHGARLLALVPELAAFGRLLDVRSSGIRDLERGLPDAQPLGHARYRFVSAGLGSGTGRLGGVPGEVLGHLLGDLVVRRGSATATLRRTGALFPEAEVLHVPGADHLSLLNHPDVLSGLRRWLAD
jgi:hypothetical protein